MFIIDQTPWLLSILLAPLGLILGSFGQILIHRLPQENPEDRKILKNPSRCPSCKMRIRWYHKIPLLSWMLLRGKCADCGWHIPFRYPLVELLTGALLAASPWLFPFGTLVWLKCVICGFALIVLFFTDLMDLMLPDAIQFPLMGLGLILTLPQIIWPGHLTRILTDSQGQVVVNTFHNGLQRAPIWNSVGQSVSWKSSLIGLLLGYVAPALLNQIYKQVRKTDVIGMGDFKMMAWLGAFWGWGTMVSIFLISILAIVVFGILLSIGPSRKTKYPMMPSGCFYALAVFPVVFFGHLVWSRIGG